MAKIKFGMMMTDARGKLGGQVFSKNRGGAYVRTKVSPINPQTSYQTAVRAIFTGFAQNFRTLTAAQILAWNNATQDFVGTNVFGDVKAPSGENLYIRLNANLAKIGEPDISDPPLPTNVATLNDLSLACDVSSATFTISSSDATVGAGLIMYIEATPPMSPGKSFVKSEFRAIGYTAANDPLPFAAGPMWTAKFGTRVAGQRVFARVRTVDTTTGLESLSQVFSTIIVP